LMVAGRLLLRSRSCLLGPLPTIIIRAVCFCLCLWSFGWRPIHWLHVAVWMCMRN